MLSQRFEPTQPTEVLIAALNEEEGIGATITELSESIAANRILVIDGHSHDRTVEVAKDSGAEIIFQDGKGKGDAIAKAVQSISEDSEFVVLTDADYTYPAEILPEMIQILEQMPWVGMVCGNRFSKKSNSSFKRRFYLGNKLLAFAHSLLNGIDLLDPLTGLRVVRADILRNWDVKSKGFDIEVELNNQVSRQGFESLEVAIDYRERLGEKKLKMKDGATILKRIIAESWKSKLLNSE
jgi:glycosyltransferase involved in cell wall biosynthesis